MKAPSAGWVFDTNVVCAGLITRDAAAPTARLVDAMLSGRVVHASSLPLIAEIDAVLRRPALARWHRLTELEIETVVAGLVRHARLVQPVTGGPVAPDPGDQHLWDLLAADAGLVLVTGDAALLASPGMAGRVLTPAACAQVQWPAQD